MHICFVCSGNICRSPSAALVFGEHLRRAGLDAAVRVSSVGIGPWHVGEPIDERAGEVLARHGYPTRHVAAQIGAEHRDADLFVAMDHGHEKALRRQVADVSRVRLLRSFDPRAVSGSQAAERGSGLEVPDPYYGGPEGFDEVLGMIEAAVPGLLDWVRERLDSA
ncbi:low molecular weight protein-tyrosine-phosphatase [Streptomyces niger]|uniref:low molecular weight protein-tyrosine-phosphatase n=1 Tax=Streptomyces niger TaxID=66373 RepID=UPI00069C1CCD|nr:low molecular weight protein-tyrosine-phosphatase [Streptomyces niger]